MIQLVVCLTRSAVAYFRSAQKFLLFTITSIQSFSKRCIELVKAFLLSASAYLRSFIKTFVLCIRSLFVYRNLKRLLMLVVFYIVVPATTPEGLIHFGPFLKPQIKSLVFAYKVWLGCLVGMSDSVIIDSDMAFVASWLYSTLVIMADIIKSSEGFFGLCFSEIDMESVVLFISITQNLSLEAALQLYNSSLIFFNTSDALSWIRDPSFNLPTDPRARSFCEGFRLMHEIQFDIISKRSGIDFGVCLGIVKAWIKRFFNVLSYFFK